MVLNKFNTVLCKFMSALLKKGTGKNEKCIFFCFYRTDV